MEPALCPFTKLKRRGDANLDSMCDVFPNYKAFTEKCHTYKEYRLVVGTGKIVQKLADKIKRHYQALEITKAKLKTLQEQSDTHTYEKTITLRLPIPGADILSKEEFMCFEEWLKEPTKTLKKIIHNKSILMFSNIKTTHETAIDKVLSTELPELLKGLKNIMTSRHISLNSSEDIFDSFMNEVKRDIMRKVKIDTERSEELKHPAEIATVNTKKTAAAVKSSIKERANQISVEDSESSTFQSFNKIKNKTKTEKTLSR